jgi:hypothetical protein
MKTYSFTTSLYDAQTGDVDAEVSFTYSAGRPGRNYMPNGDPGYPDEPAELDIVSVKVFGVEVGGDFLEQHGDRIEQAAIDYIEETVADQMEAYWSSRAAAMREEA